MRGTARSTTRTLRTGGLVVAVESDNTRLTAQLLAGAGGTGVADDPRSAPDLTLTLESSPARFATTGLLPITRGVWGDGDGTAVVEDVGSSGFAQRWRVRDGRVHVRTRWVPRTTERAAARLLPQRFRALRSQVLLHYPVLWAAGLRGMAPLHVSVVQVGEEAVVLAGPGGVGKSTLVARELRTGGRAACDNLAVSDGTTTYGVREPLRLHTEHLADLAPDVRHGGRTTHGRRESPWSTQVASLDPDLVVVVRRGSPTGPSTTVVPPASTARSLVAGTYAAGELSRFWPLVAALALATGHGPAHPPVGEVAAALTGRLPCLTVELGTGQDNTLASLLSGERAPLHPNEVVS